MNKFILFTRHNLYEFKNYEEYNEISATNINNYIIKLILIILLLLLIIYFPSFNKNQLYLKTEEEEGKKYNYKMQDYSLYNLTKYPQITILINNVENEEKLLNLTKQILNQTLKDIQILYLFQNDTKEIIKSLIKNYSLIDERINIIQIKSINENIFQIMEKISGKFILFLEKILNFGHQQFEKFYNFTKGKTNNIFEFSISNNSLYLIKTKILSKLLDEGNFIFNYTGLINHIKGFPSPIVYNISIAFCPNNLYIPLTYVAMISVLKNKYFNTYISFYLIISKDFKPKNFNFINSLFEQFDFFNITFIKIDDRYKNAYISRRMSYETYYRFSLGELLPDLNKIIYLDGDVIVYKDLSNLFELNFNGKFVLGQVTGNNRNKKTGFYRINNGILLFNLYNMRKYKIEKKVMEIIKKGQHLFYHDQTLMNNYFKKFIGIFQIEYHIRNWNNFSYIQKFNAKSGKVYDDDVFYFAAKYPSIRHFLGKSKPNKFNFGHTEDWWYFARQSKFYVKKSRDSSKVFNFSFS